MKEVELISKQSFGKSPYDHWTLVFRIKSIEYTISEINHFDYMVFRSKFYAKTASGWSGYNFLKNKYRVDKSSENTPEENAELLSNLERLRKMYPAKED